MFNTSKDIKNPKCKYELVAWNKADTIIWLLWLSAITSIDGSDILPKINFYF